MIACRGCMGHAMRDGASHLDLRIRPVEKVHIIRLARIADEHLTTKRPLGDHHDTQVYGRTTLARGG